MRWNSYGHSALVASSSEELLSPKSSLTDRSAAAELLGDSLVLLPRNSHLDVRAKPCWGSLEVASWSGAVPKTYPRVETSTMSVNFATQIHPSASPEGILGAGTVA